MKKNTSIMLSPDVIAKINRRATHGYSRSGFIEHVLRGCLHALGVPGIPAEKIPEGMCTPAGLRELALDLRVFRSMAKASENEDGPP
jgi:hypothetical protein